MNFVGRVPRHGSFSQFPWENIDTVTGDVSLSFVDLSLPGNAGFNLNITRTLNMAVPETTAWPDGEWRFGIIPGLECYAGFREGRLTLPDGRSLLFIPTPAPNVYITDGDFWRVTCGAAESTAERPDGTVWHFAMTGSMGHADRMEDRHGNRVDVERDPTLHRVTRLVQHVGNDTREVSFAYSGSPVSAISEITYAGRVWHYDWFQSPDFSTSRLEVTPPVGPAWSYDSVKVRREELHEGQTWRWWGHTLTVGTPPGGTVTYEMSGYSYCGYIGQPIESTPRNCGHNDSVRLRSRTIGGHEVNQGTWSFSYEQLPAVPYLEYATTISGPGYYAYHKHWMEPLEINEILVGNSSTDILERTTFQWADARQWPMLDWYRWAYTDRVPVYVQTERDGRTYRRDFFYDDNTVAGSLGHFGQPIRVVDTGDFTRTTEFAYQTFTGAAWIADAVRETKVDSIVTSEATYDLATAFATSRTVMGVPTTYVPDAHGNIESATDADSHTTSYTYDWGVLKDTITLAYRITRSIDPDGTVASEGHHEVGRAERVIASYQHDGLGRLTVTTPDAGATTTIAYDLDSGTEELGGDGRLTKTTRDGAIERRYVDGFGRVVKTRSAAGAVLGFKYDALGRKQAESVPCADCDPETLPDGSWTWFEYDALDRILKQTNPVNPTATTVTYSYGTENGALKVTITDENGHETVQRWTAVGHPSQARLVAVEQKSGVEGTSETTTYTYDGLDALTKVVHATYGLERRWTYDTHHRLSTEHHPEAEEVTYTYSEAGRLESRLDAHGLTTYGYDGSGRLTSITPPNSEPATALSYDEWGHRDTATRDGVTTTFTYSSAQRLQSRVDVINGHRFTTTWMEYDDRDHPTRIRYPSGRIIGYSYDAGGRVRAVCEADPNRAPNPHTDACQDRPRYAEEIAYHPSGAVASLTHGNGVSDTFTFNERQWPLTVRVNNGALLDLTYDEYDHAGNVKRIGDLLRPALSQTFTYDGVDRLETAGGPWGSLTYTYDALGNRRSVTAGTEQTTYTYFEATNRLRSVGGDVEREYDGAGNLTRDPLGSYTYSSSHMLTTARVNNVLHQFAYDADDQRVTKSEGSLRTTYFLRGGEQVLSEYEDEGSLAQWTADYVYAGSRLVARVSAVRDASLPDTLWPGQMLWLGQRRTSLDGRYTLVYQEDGNLVLYRANWTPVWWSQTAGTTPGRTEMETNGNLKMYDAEGDSFFQSQTIGHPGAHLVVGNDGRVRIYAPTGETLWEVGEGLPTPTDRLLAGQSLYANDALYSASGTYYLAYQSDGNLVLYDYLAWVPIWWSGTSGTSVGRALMQSDGNFVVYDAAVVARFWTGTWGHPGAYLVVEDNGQVVVRAGSGEVLWAAPSSPSTLQAAAGAAERGGPSVVGMLSEAMAAPSAGADGGWGTRIGAARASLSGEVEAVEYYHQDALGSTRLLTDETGAVVRYHDFLPFGEEWNRPTGATETRLFTGKERDLGTGLDYFGARYLASDVGRFTTVDPVYTWTENLVDPQRWNRYTYSLNNPLRYIDPDGKVPVPVIIGAAAASRWLASPQGQRVVNAVGTRAQSVWIAATRFFGSAAGQETVQILGEFLTGAELPTCGVAGAAHGIDAGFDSFRALKRSWGAAGEGRVWHHIVEQSKVAQFGDRMINAPFNVIAVGREINEKLSAFYSSKQPFSGKVTVREWLKGKSWEEQYRLGVEWLDKARKGEL